MQSAGTHDTGIYPSGNPCQGLSVQCRGGAYQSRSIPAEIPVKDYPYNAEVELINPVADTVANANYRGADVEWYIKADDIVLKNKGGQPAGNPQNHAPQGQQKNK